MLDTKSQIRDLTSIVLSVLLMALLLGGSFWILRPFLPALIWAAMIVIPSWGIMLKIQALLRGSRTMAVLVMSAVLMLVLIFPLTVAITAIIENMEQVREKAHQLFAQGFPQAPERLKDIPLIGPKLQSRWQQIAGLGHEEALTKISPFVGTALKWLVQQIGGLGAVFVHFLLTLILSAILYFKGESAASGVLSFARRLAGQRGEEAVLLAAQSIRAVASGVIVTALVQSLMAGFGLLLAAVPFALILTCLTFLLSVIQLGAGPVLIGAIIWLFYKDYTLTAWLFLIWSVIVMGVDNFIRPFLIKRGANLPLLLIFAGVIGGLISFGIIGIFVGPVVLAVTYTLLQAWTAETPQELKT